MPYSLAYLRITKKIVIVIQKKRKNKKARAVIKREKRKGKLTCSISILETLVTAMIYWGILAEIKAKMLSQIKLTC